jgi:hypothetical protein
MILSLSGCALGGGSAPIVGQGLKKRAGFYPGQTHREFGGHNYVLIDSIQMPKAKYQINQSLIASGRVSFLVDSPNLKSLYCEGNGYEVSYEEQNRLTSSQIRLVPFLNGQEAQAIHLDLSPEQQLSVAVYAEYNAISEYYDQGRFPVETVKSFQPNGKCLPMCQYAPVTTVRPLVRTPQQPCNLFSPEPGSSAFYFKPYYMEKNESRADVFSELKACDAVRNNQELEDLYHQAEAASDCPNHARKELLREWTEVEEKIIYKSAVYDIENFNKIITNLNQNQDVPAVSGSVATASEWL